ncbi:hypothetical protein [Streptomyces lincolnensis]|uniref:hypothetical protein n=1 Tax=Streptomyces lincolnensis TaxID=1915 RepID=UPI00082FBEED|nr:hypothetical protein [Streptomyces lincolnensis]QMV05892.1 hypothetical protein GJU35_09680 [Streptomyces lincolnensis]
MTNESSAAVAQMIARLKAEMTGSLDALWADEVQAAQGITDFMEGRLILQYTRMGLEALSVEPPTHQ